ncbi:hypothetical protein E2C01_008825 [Portunus trituberculatus]|uniref:Uncharacterized protein n=1 Tax=Portunus trituberculatus TaxID=210409 RepID=A0A5B7D1U7_PORTR|nr:hypothetical protein [Portunus trituberculatus]
MIIVKEAEEKERFERYSTPGSRHVEVWFCVVGSFWPGLALDGLPCCWSFLSSPPLAWLGLGLGLGFGLVSFWLGLGLGVVWFWVGLGLGSFWVGFGLGLGVVSWVGCGLRVVSFSAGFAVCGLAVDCVSWLGLVS